MTLVCRRRRHLDTCVNDDSTSDSFGDTCSSYYDYIATGCGGYDDEEFTAGVQCCACGGSKRCDIVVSGSSSQSPKHGTYQQSGTCEGHPRWKCDDCGGGDKYIWYYTSSNWWLIGNDACTNSAAMYISDPDEDLAAVSGTWSEASGSGIVSNSAISVTCAVSCAYPSYQGNGYCTPSNNVASCEYDGGDCCESTCVSTDDYTCGVVGYTCLAPGACSAKTLSGVPSPSRRH